jgi:Uma2 family endonuclease
MLNAMDPHLERRRFTADEYQRMGEVGILSPDERLELIDGEIVTMTPIGPPHAAAVDRATLSFVTAVNRRAIVRVRGSVRLDFLTEPEPDVVLLRPRADFYASAHPGPQDILLIVEIAGSSLRYDRDVKSKLYAHLGIVEYWLADLTSQTVTCYASPEGDRYRDIRSLVRGASLAPLALADVVIQVDDLLD